MERVEKFLKEAETYKGDIVVYQIMVLQQWLLAKEGEQNGTV